MIPIETNHSPVVLHNRRSCLIQMKYYLKLLGGVKKRVLGRLIAQKKKLKKSKKTKTQITKTRHQEQHISA